MFSKKERNLCRDVNINYIPQLSEATNNNINVPLFLFHFVYANYNASLKFFVSFLRNDVPSLLTKTRNKVLIPFDWRSNSCQDR